MEIEPKSQLLVIYSFWNLQNLSNKAIFDRKRDVLREVVVCAGAAHVAGAARVLPAGQRGPAAACHDSPH